MAAGNALNISQAGYVIHDGHGKFTGNAFVAGTGITLTNNSGIAGNTIISLSPTTSAFDYTNSFLLGGM